MIQKGLCIYQLMGCKLFMAILQINGIWYSQCHMVALKYYLKNYSWMGGGNIYMHLFICLFVHSSSCAKSFPFHCNEWSLHLCVLGMCIGKAPRTLDLSSYQGVLWNPIYHRIIQFIYLKIQLKNISQLLNDPRIKEIIEAYINDKEQIIPENSSNQLQINRCGLILNFGAFLSLSIVLIRQSPAILMFAKAIGSHLVVLLLCKKIGENKFLYSTGKIIHDSCNPAYSLELIGTVFKVLMLRVVHCKCFSCYFVV